MSALDSLLEFLSSTVYRIGYDDGIEAVDGLVAEFGVDYEDGYCDAVSDVVNGY